MPVIEFDDGIIAYSADLPALGGLGFALDPNAFEAKQNGQLIQMAYERGFRWIASMNYANFAGTLDMNTAETHNYVQSLWFLANEDLTGFEFRPVRLAEGSGTVFLEIVRTPHAE